MKRVPVPLNLDRWLSKDARRCVWRLLNGVDREMVRCAHNRKRWRKVVMDQITPWQIASCGYLKLLQWSVEYIERMFCRLSTCEYDLIMVNACKSGHLPVVKWAVQQPVTKEWSERVFRTNHLHILQWLLKHCDESWTREDNADILLCRLVERTAKHGNSEIFFWLIETFPVILSEHLSDVFSMWQNSMSSAARHRQFHMLPLLYKYGSEYIAHRDGNIIYGLIKHGAVDWLQWWAETTNSNPFTSARYCLWAAEKNQLAVLQWLRSQQINCPWTEGVLNIACELDHAELFEWARANGAPLNSYTERVWCRKTTLDRACKRQRRKQ